MGARRRLNHFSLEECSSRHRDVTFGDGLPSTAIRAALQNRAAFLCPLRPSPAERPNPPVFAECKITRRLRQIRNRGGPVSRCPDAPARMAREFRTVPAPALRRRRCNSQFRLVPAAKP